ncbi:S9 family peptidase [Lentisalinibacter orientalis]|uniref:S9 family peptidase n=1 Tax=Lentisalinibacter orientalis TaxID=2992241 RepID=UPI003864DECF
MAFSAARRRIGRIGRLVWVRRVGPIGLAAVAVALAAGPAGAAGAQGLTGDDLVELKRLSEPAVAPDRSAVAYTLRETDRAADRGRTDIWLLALQEDAAPRRLTNHPENDTSPQWSPDGERLYFLSARSGTRQVWMMPLDFGEPIRVTDYPVPVSTFRLSPDGTTLAFTAAVLPDCEADLACTAERLAARAESPETGRVYDRLMVRHWDRWEDGTVSRLFTASLGGDGLAGEAPPRLASAGLLAEIPSRPFGGVADYVFSPDGRGLVFTAKPEDRQEAWSTDYDLYAVAAGGGRVRNLTGENPGRDGHPVFSPDGERLAWLSMATAGYESDRRRIMLRETDSGRTRQVAPEWDRSPSEIAFSTDGREIYAVAQDWGRRLLFRIDIESGSVLPLTAAGTAGSISVGPESVVFVKHSLRAPADLHRLDLETLALEKITAVNHERLADIRMAEFAQFSFPGWNDETVYGYVMEPADRDPEAKYPIAFLIHGGPQGSFADQFHYRWNPQVYAAAGYGVVFIDFHGSTGYGQAFTDSINGDWGGKPLTDLKRGLEAALAAYPWLDGERACALGASYGGYMINWIAGNWPERFRCLVNHDGLFDLRMMYFATEELWFPEHEFGGPYYAGPTAYENHNPVHYVTNWRTPMLVVHGALDYRVPGTQALATFAALQRQGVESRLLWYPDENHWVLKPANSVQWHREVLGWLERYLAR